MIQVLTADMIGIIPQIFQIEWRIVFIIIRLTQLDRLFRVRWESIQPQAAQL